MAIGGRGHFHVKHFHIAHWHQRHWAELGVIIPAAVYHFFRKILRPVLRKLVRQDADTGTNYF